MKHLYNFIKKEDGQDMVEFALVLPIFLLLVMGIIDFGWLFYNYISVENSARNAARIACVEYVDCCYDKQEQEVVDRELTYQKSGEEYVYVDKNHTGDELTTQEKDIVSTVQNTLPGSVKDVTIDIVYTYDTSYSATQGYDISKRSDGDVIVTVKGKMKVLTPVLGVFSENMTRTLTSKSTFKVEKQYDPGA